MTRAAGKAKGCIGNERTVRFRKLLINLLRRRRSGLVVSLQRIYEPGGRGFESLRPRHLSEFDQELEKVVAPRVRVVNVYGQRTSACQSLTMATTTPEADPVRRWINGE